MLTKSNVCISEIVNYYYRFHNFYYYNPDNTKNRPHNNNRLNQRPSATTQNQIKNFLNKKSIIFIRKPSNYNILIPILKEMYFTFEFDIYNINKLKSKTIYCQILIITNTIIKNDTSSSTSILLQIKNNIKFKHCIMYGIKN